MTKWALLEGGLVAAISLVSRPSPWVETDEEVFAGFSYDGTNFSAPAPVVTPIEDQRAEAQLSRSAFLRACVSAGIITEAIAEEAASGVWPVAFDPFIAGLTAEERIEAKATWADGGAVRRDNPILALIAAHEGVTDAQLDLMFGIA